MKYCVGAMCYIELEAENRNEAVKKFFEQCPLETYEVDIVLIQDKKGHWVDEYELENEEKEIRKSLDRLK